MKYILIVLLILTSIFLLYKEYSGLNNVFYKLQDSIYGKCIPNFNYKKFDGKIIGRKLYFSAIEVQYFYKSYQYYCVIPDSNFEKYKNGTIIEIYVDPIPSLLNQNEKICYTCEVRADPGDFGVLGFLYIIIWCFSIPFCMFLNLYIISLIIDFVPSELELLLKLKNYYNVNDYREVPQQDLEENVELQQIQKLTIKCPLCQKINNFYLNKQKMFETTDTECVVCKTNKSNIFFPECQHTIICDSCAPLLVIK